MFTKDDLIDAILEALPASGAGGRPMGVRGAPVPATLSRGVAKFPVKGENEAPLPGRVFLSDYDIRKRLTQGARELRIPKGAIVSPLAQEWLSLKRIRIVEE